MVAWNNSRYLMPSDPTVLATLDQLITMVRDVQAKQKAQADRLSRLEGKSDVMLSWLQSMDQRFSALMAPINPPRIAS